MKIVLVISTLGAGGAERVLSTMANFWVSQGRGIEILTFDDGSKAPFYELDRRIRHRPLHLLGDSKHLLEGFLNNLERIRLLRRAVRESRPDAVISFTDQTNVVTLLATRKLAIPVAVSERIDPAMHRIGRIWSAIRTIVYGWADAVVVQTREAAAYFPRKLQQRISVIPNPVTEPRSGQDPGVPMLKRPCIVAMGRLAPQKGFDLLLEAFFAICKDHPKWSLTIFGEGPERGRLEKRVDQLGLKDRIFLPGTVKNSGSVFRQADLFVLSSRYEGYPNVLCEAMASGLPAISFDCPSGPAHIVTDGANGVLVPAENSGLLAEEMDRLMADESERNRLGENARKAGQRFQPEKIMARWNDVLSRILAN